MGAFVRWLQRAMMSKKNRCPKEEHWLNLVRLMLDGQTTAEENEYVMKHLDSCYRCYDNFDVEKAIREALKNNTLRMSVSEEVISEIKEKVNP